MMKYGILLSKGDNETVLETHTDKDIALERGAELRKLYTREQGLINCVKTDFDEKNNMINPNKQICIKAWIF